MRCQEPWERSLGFEGEAPSSHGRRTSGPRFGLWRGDKPPNPGGAVGLDADLRVLRCRGSGLGNEKRETPAHRGEDKVSRIASLRKAG